MQLPSVLRRIEEMFDIEHPVVGDLAIDPSQDLLVLVIAQPGYVVRRQYTPEISVHVENTFHQTMLSVSAVAMLFTCLSLFLIPTPRPRSPSSITPTLI